MKKRELLVIGLMVMTIVAGCAKNNNDTDVTNSNVIEIENEQVNESIEATNEESTEVESAEAVETDANTQLANPWSKSDKQGVLDATGFSIDAPAEATDIAYSYMAEGEMAQLSYVMDGNDWTYRMKPADELTDISGMYYDWVVEDKGTVSGCDAVYLGYSDATENMDTIDDVNGVQVVNWYDAVTGVTYSLSVTGKDLNGMDLQVYAENIYQPLQGEVTDDAEADETSEIQDYFLGEHERSEDGSTVTIADNGDGTFKVDISIIRLCLLENGVGKFEDHKINFTVEDPNENELQGVIYRDSDNSLVVKITDSTWTYLPNGEILDGFGK